MQLNFKTANYSFKCCPYSYIDFEMVGEALEAYHYFSNGFLPNEGTILDQSSFFILASKLVKSHVGHLSNN